MLGFYDKGSQRWPNFCFLTSDDIFQNALICWIFNFVVVEVHSNECEESVKLDDAKECEPFLWVRHYFWLSLDYGDESERYIL